MNKFIVFVLQFLLVINLAFGADKYCDYTNGDDANDCSNTTTELCKTVQRCVNVATGGDSLFIANTSAQIFTSSLTWNTGFTADNTKILKFIAWDNGGSITIQRPDEDTPRTGAIFSGNNTVNQVLTYAPPRTSFINIRFTGFTTHTLDSYGGFPYTTYGCEWTGLSGTSYIIFGRSLSKNFNAYIHTNTTSRVAVEIGTENFNEISDSWIAHRGSSGISINVDSTGTVIKGNKIIFTHASQKGIHCANDCGTIEGNTFVGNGLASQEGIDKNNANAIKVVNNIFYNFDGASSNPANLSGTNFVYLYGYNAYYSSNAPTLPTNIHIDLGSDITDSGDPFVDSVNNDFTLKTDSLARGAGLSNPNSFVDIGAVQSKSEAIVPSADQNEVRANRSCS